MAVSAKQGGALAIRTTLSEIHVADVRHRTRQRSVMSLSGEDVLSAGFESQSASAGGATAVRLALRGESWTASCSIKFLHAIEAFTRATGVHSRGTATRHLRLAPAARRRSAFSRELRAARSGTPAAPSLAFSCEKTLGFRLLLEHRRAIIARVNEFNIEMGRLRARTTRVQTPYGPGIQVASNPARGIATVRLAFAVAYLPRSRVVPVAADPVAASRRKDATRAHSRQKFQLYFSGAGIEWVEPPARDAAAAAAATTDNPAENQGVAGADAKQHEKKKNEVPPTRHPILTLGGVAATAELCGYAATSETLGSRGSGARVEWACEVSCDGVVAASVSPSAVAVCTGAVAQWQLAQKKARRGARKRRAAAHRANAGAVGAIGDAKMRPQRLAAAEPSTAQAQSITSRKMRVKLKVFMRRVQLHVAEYSENVRKPAAPLAVLWAAGVESRLDYQQGNGSGSPVSLSLDAKRLQAIDTSARAAPTVQVDVAQMSPLDGGASGDIAGRSRTLGFVLFDTHDRSARRRRRRDTQRGEAQQHSDTIWTDTVSGSEAATPAADSDGSDEGKGHVATFRVEARGALQSKTPWSYSVSMPSQATLTWNPVTLRHLWRWAVVASGGPDAPPTPSNLQLSMDGLRLRLFKPFRPRWLADAKLRGVRALLTEPGDGSAEWTGRIRHVRLTDRRGTAASQASPSAHAGAELPVAPALLFLETVVAPAGGPRSGRGDATGTNGVDSSACGIEFRVTSAAERDVARSQCAGRVEIKTLGGLRGVYLQLLFEEVQDYVQNGLVWVFKKSAKSAVSTEIDTTAPACLRPSTPRDGEAKAPLTHTRRDTSSSDGPSAAAPTPPTEAEFVRLIFRLRNVELALPLSRAAAGKGVVLCVDSVDVDNERVLSARGGAWAGDEKIRATFSGISARQAPRELQNTRLCRGLSVAVEATFPPHRPRPLITPTVAPIRVLVTVPALRATLTSLLVERLLQLLDGNIGAIPSGNPEPSISPFRFHNPTHPSPPLHVLMRIQDVSARLALSGSTAAQKTVVGGQDQVCVVSAPLLELRFRSPAEEKQVGEARGLQESRDIKTAETAETAETAVLKLPRVKSSELAVDLASLVVSAGVYVQGKSSAFLTLGGVQRAVAGADSKAGESIYTQMMPRLAPFHVERQIDPGVSEKTTMVIRDARISPDVVFWMRAGEYLRRIMAVPSVRPPPARTEVACVAANAKVVALEPTATLGSRGRRAGLCVSFDMTAKAKQERGSGATDMMRGQIHAAGVHLQRCVETPGTPLRLGYSLSSPCAVSFTTRHEEEWDAQATARASSPLSQPRRLIRSDTQVRGVVERCEWYLSMADILTIRSLFDVAAAQGSPRKPTTRAPQTERPAAVKFGVGNRSLRRSPFPSPKRGARAVATGRVDPTPQPARALTIRVSCVGTDVLLLQDDTATSMVGPVARVSLDNAVLAAVQSDKTAYRHMAGCVSVRVYDRTRVAWGRLVHPTKFDIVSDYAAEAGPPARQRNSNSTKSSMGGRPDRATLNINSQRRAIKNRPRFTHIRAVSPLQVDLHLWSLRALNEALSVVASVRTRTGEPLSPQDESPSPSAPDEKVPGTRRGADPRTLTYAIRNETGLPLQLRVRWRRGMQGKGDGSWGDLDSGALTGDSFRLRAGSSKRLGPSASTEHQRAWIAQHQSAPLDSGFALSVKFETRGKARGDLLSEGKGAAETATEWAAVEGVAPVPGTQVYVLQTKGVAVPPGRLFVRTHTIQDKSQTRKLISLSSSLQFKNGTDAPLFVHVTMVETCPHLPRGITIGPIRPGQTRALPISAGRWKTARVRPVPRETEEKRQDTKNVFAWSEDTALRRERSSSVITTGPAVLECPASPQKSAQKDAESSTFVCVALRSRPLTPCGPPSDGLAIDRECWPLAVTFLPFAKIFNLFPVPMHYAVAAKSGDPDAPACADGSDMVLLRRASLAAGAAADLCVGHNGFQSPHFVSVRLEGTNWSRWVRVESRWARPHRESPFSARVRLVRTAGRQDEPSRPRTNSHTTQQKRKALCRRLLASVRAAQALRKAGDRVHLLAELEKVRALREAVRQMDRAAERLKRIQGLPKSLQRETRRADKQSDGLPDQAPLDAVVELGLGENQCREIRVYCQYWVTNETNTRLWYGVDPNARDAEKDAEKDSVVWVSDSPRGVGLVATDEGSLAKPPLVTPPRLRLFGAVSLKSAINLHVQRSGSDAKGKIADQSKGARSFIRLSALDAINDTVARLRHVENKAVGGCDVAVEFDPAPGVFFRSTVVRMCPRLTLHNETTHTLVLFQNTGAAGQQPGPVPARSFNAESLLAELSPGVAQPVLCRCGVQAPAVRVAVQWNPEEHWNRGSQSRGFAQGEMKASSPLRIFAAGDSAVRVPGPSGQALMLRVHVVTKRSQIHVHLRVETNESPLYRLRNESDIPVGYRQLDTTTTTKGRVRRRANPWALLGPGESVPFAWDAPLRERLEIQINTSVCGGDTGDRGVISAPLDKAGFCTVTPTVSKTVSGSRQAARPLVLEVLSEGPTKTLRVSAAAGSAGTDKVGGQKQSQKTHTLHTLLIDAPRVVLSLTDSQNAEVAAEPRPDPTEKLNMARSKHGLHLVATLERVRFRSVIEAKSMNWSTHYSFQIDAAQINNVSRVAYFPVPLIPVRPTDIHNPFLKLSAVHVYAPPTADTHHTASASAQDILIRSASTAIAPLRLSLDAATGVRLRDLLMGVSQIHVGMGQDGISHTRHQISSSLSRLLRRGDRRQEGGLLYSRLHVGELQVHPLTVRLSYFSQPSGPNNNGASGPASNASSGADAGADQDLTPVQAQQGSWHLTTLHSVATQIDDAALSFGGLRLEDRLLTPAALVQELTRHYKAMATLHVLKIVGSASLLGNPAGLIDNITTGLNDLLVQPAVALGKGHLGSFAGGIASGSLSMVKNSLYGVSNTALVLTNTLGGGLASFSFDEKYVKARFRQALEDHRPAHALSGLLQGTKALGKGVLHGIGGLFAAPIEGAAQSGLKGFVGGMGRGVMGLVFKPAAGALDAVSKLSEGIKNTTTIFDKAAKPLPVRIQVGSPLPKSRLTGETSSEPDTPTTRRCVARSRGLSVAGPPAPAAKSVCDPGLVVDWVEGEDGPWAVFWRESGDQVRGRGQSAMLRLGLVGPAGRAEDAVFDTFVVEYRGQCVALRCKLSGGLKENELGDNVSADVRPNLDRSDPAKLGLFYLSVDDKDGRIGVVRMLTRPVEPLNTPAQSSQKDGLASTPLVASLSQNQMFRLVPVPSELRGACGMVRVVTPGGRRVLSVRRGWLCTVIASRRALASSYSLFRLRAAPDTRLSLFCPFLAVWLVRSHLNKTDAKSRRSSAESRRVAVLVPSSKNPTALVQASGEGPFRASLEPAVVSKCAGFRLRAENGSYAVLGSGSGTPLRWMRWDASDQAMVNGSFFFLSTAQERRM